MKVKDYKELLVWQKGIDITDKIYLVTENFHKHELYGLTAQMRRASVSVPANVAEGFMRRNSKEYRQFLHISLGSCAELETELIISFKRNYFNKEMFEEIQDNINHEMRMIVNLIKELNN